MENKVYKYDAFISYRHCELDKYVAVNLHKILENYDLPKTIKNKLNIEGKAFKRIFRDQEELPLSSNLEDPIIEALNDSKFLIVICSPRLKDSLWCKKEIETFKKIRGRKNILCVLVEGEPSESFPEEVLYDEKEVKQKNGKIKKEKILVEPLAADVRGNSKTEVLKKIKEEKLRLVAGMLNVDYDDLKQRHKLRKQKRIIAMSSAIACFCLFFALYTSVMLLKINKQKNTLREHQALSLSSKAIEYLDIDDRYDAVKASYQALTKFDGVSMPYTSDAEYALSESLGVYDVGSSYKSISEIKTKGVADYIKSTSDRKFAAIYDESGELTIIDTKTMSVIKTFSVNSNVFTRESFSFIGSDKLSFINEKGNINIVNLNNGKILKEFKSVDRRYISVLGNSNSNLLVYATDKSLYIYSLDDDKELNSVTVNDKYLKEIYFSLDGKYIFASSTNEGFDVNKNDYLTIHVINSESGKEVNNETFDAGYISGIVTSKNNAYLLLNNAFGSKFNMLVVSYNFIDAKVNWSKSYEGDWGTFIINSYDEKINHIAVVNYDGIRVLDGKDGSVINSTTTSSEIINIYTSKDKEIYVLFLNNGTVNFFSMDAGENIILKGKFEFNIAKYSEVAQSKNGFILLPENENRVVLYEEKYNKNMKKVDTKIDFVSDESIVVTKFEEVINKYKIKNKNLVEKIFYDTKKEILFVNYTNNDVSIYDVKTKKHLKTLENVGKVYHYFGKDKLGRTYIGDMSDSYILDKDYNKVGHIKGLVKLDNNKVIILYNGEYYSLEVYDLDALLKEAKKYISKK